MAAARLATAPVRCAACRQQIVESFTGLRVSRTSSQPQWRHRKLQSSSRSFHQASSLLQQRGSTAKNDEYLPERRKEVITSQEPAEAREDEARTEDHKPWYLEEQEHLEEKHPFAHRQRLPELPPNSPPLLQPLLKHLSVDTGLDYLKLFDLRNVDPPPAFGANLFMIFGTARSEKHLNVSADRLCRWLRSEHKLTPYADGLLGRQELKLRLRRKARRTKLLSAAGAINPGSLQLDDGTRTGWVCVNIGDIRGSAPQLAEDDLIDDFVGFGSGADSVKIVIQMMTEEKRVELDLETLWQGILNGSDRRQQALESAEASSPEPVRDQTSRRYVFSAPETQRRQLRTFHTTARRLASNETTTSQEISMMHPDYAAHTVDFRPKNLEIKDAGLASDLGRLRSLGAQLGVTALGYNSGDRGSTDFLKEFYAKVPVIRTTDHFNAQLKLHQIGIDMGHLKYTSGGLWDILKQMEASCVPIPAETFLFVLNNVLGSRVLPPATIAITDYKSSTLEKHERTHLSHYSPMFTRLEKTLYIAFDVLERMEAHGHPRMPLSFFLALHRCITTPTVHRPTDPQNWRITERERDELQQRYYASLKLIFPENELLPRPLVLDMLQTWGHRRNWGRFWRLWRDMALEGCSRDADMYAIMFASIAADGSARAARAAVTEHLPEMQREVPPVPLDERSAVAVLRCLRNMGYDPRAETNGHLDVHAPVWDRCWRLGNLERRTETSQTARESSETREALSA